MAISLDFLKSRLIGLDDDRHISWKAWRVGADLKRIICAHPLLIVLLVAAFIAMVY